MERLTEGIRSLTGSARWREWLEVQSRFHRYSFHNVMLILAQRPDATRVAGYRAWRALDRFVRRGEKGIRILAPVVARARQGDPEPGPGAETLRGFRPVSVFDVSQTEGRELPEVCARLHGEAGDGVFERLVAAAHELGFAVTLTVDLPAGVNGDCSHGRRRIRVRATNASAQRVKTLAHELGHAVLHAELGDRALAELEAESVAFIVCGASGVATDRYSFGYVATWAGGGTGALAAIKASGTRIQRAAEQILRLAGEPGPPETAAMGASASGGHRGEGEVPVGVEGGRSDGRGGGHDGVPGPAQGQPGGHGEPGVGVIGAPLAPREADLLTDVYGGDAAGPHFEVGRTHDRGGPAHEDRPGREVVVAPGARKGPAGAVGRPGRDGHRGRLAGVDGGVGDAEGDEVPPVPAGPRGGDQGPVVPAVGPVLPVGVGVVEAELEAATRPGGDGPGDPGALALGLGRDRDRLGPRAPVGVDAGGRPGPRGGPLAAALTESPDGHAGRERPGAAREPEVGEDPGPGDQGDAQADQDPAQEVPAVRRRRGPAVRTARRFPDVGGGCGDLSGGGHGPPVP